MQELANEPANERHRTRALAVMAPAATPITMMPEAPQSYTQSFTEDEGDN